MYVGSGDDSSFFQSEIRVRARRRTAFLFRKAACSHRLVPERREKSGFFNSLLSLIFKDSRDFVFFDFLLSFWKGKTVEIPNFSIFSRLLRQRNSRDFDFSIFSRLCCLKRREKSGIFQFSTVFQNGRQ